MILMRTKRTARKDITAKSPRADMLRTLALGGAGGNYGFGRYPEGVFASVRYMVVLFAKRVTA